MSQGGVVDALTLEVDLDYRAEGAGLVDDDRAAGLANALERPHALEGILVRAQRQYHRQAEHHRQATHRIPHLRLPVGRSAPVAWINHTGPAGGTSKLLRPVRGGEAGPFADDAGDQPVGQPTGNAHQERGLPGEVVDLALAPEGADDAEGGV